MSYFEAAVQTTGAAAGAAFCMLQNTGATGKGRMRLRELGLTTNAGTLSSVGLIRAATVGTTSGSPTPGQVTDDLDTTTPLGQIVIGWSVAPTIAGTPLYLRQFVAAAVQGSGIVWTWPIEAPLVVSPTAGLLLWNFGGGAGSALSVYARWEE